MENTYIVKNISLITTEKKMHNKFKNYQSLRSFGRANAMKKGNIMEKTHNKFAKYTSLIARDVGKPRRPLQRRYIYY